MYGHQLNSVHSIDPADYEMVNFTRTLVGIQNPMCVEGFLISTLEDSLVEAYEEFTIQLTSSSFIVSTANDTIQITIENDDGEHKSVSQPQTEFNNSCSTLATVECGSIY